LRFIWPSTCQNLNLFNYLILCPQWPRPCDSVRLAEGVTRLSNVCWNGGLRFANPPHELILAAMTDKPTYNDAPIIDPSADRFGIDPFATALAASIRKIGSPEGTVVALNGPWGSGKSSAVNLLLYHLKDAVDAGEIDIINFACWWFRGEEALALAFFRELYAGLGPSLGDRFKQALPKIGARLYCAPGAQSARALILPAAPVLVRSRPVR
jgi:KAP family P-loop domain